MTVDSLGVARRRVTSLLERTVLPGSPAKPAPLHSTIDPGLEAGLDNIQLSPAVPAQSDGPLGLSLNLLGSSEEDSATLHLS